VTMPWPKGKRNLTFAGANSQLNSSLTVARFDTDLTSKRKSEAPPGPDRISSSMRGDGTRCISNSST